MVTIVSTEKELTKEERKCYKKTHPGKRLCFRLRHPNFPIVSSIVALIVDIIALVIILYYT